LSLPTTAAGIVIFNKEKGMLLSLSLFDVAFVRVWIENPLYVFLFYARKHTANTLPKTEQAQRHVE